MAFRGQALSRLYKDLEALGHAVVQLEHAGLVARPESERVPERALYDEIFPAAPGSITLGPVEVEHQRGPRADGRFGGGGVPNPVARQKLLPLVGERLQGLLNPL